MAGETSCGVLVFQERPRRSFLVLVRDDRLDLPKGRRKRGEDHLACALRELEEETGISPHAVRVVQGFRLETVLRRGTPREKRVVLFAGELDGPVRVQTPEHDDYAWVPWHPTRALEPEALARAPLIREALAAWQTHVAARTSRHDPAERHHRRAS